MGSRADTTFFVESVGFMPSNVKRTAEISTPKLVIVLARAYRSLAEFLEGGLALQGISLRDFGILEVLPHKGPLSVAVMAPKLQVPSAAMGPRSFG
jgi:MarR family 2-MHQ and catechol resistance regulon transcriptional repressor